MKRGTKKTPPDRKARTGRARDAKKGAEPELSFEQALERLEDIVHRLEEGEIPLEESIEAYAEGTQLVRRCMEKLSAAETMIKELSEDAEGFRLEPSALDAADDGEDEDDDEKEGDDEDDREEDHDEEGSGELPF
jgi:exodeoxyribonuclease VII small subunit